jgi:hypothetical protein
MFPGAGRLAKSLLSLSVLVAVATLSACSNEETMIESQSEAVDESRSDAGDALPVRQWYPKPKAVIGHAYVPTVPVTPYAGYEQGQSAYQGAPGTAYGQYVWQPAPAQQPAYGFAPPAGMAQQQPAQPWSQPYPQVQVQQQPQFLPASPQYQYQQTWSAQTGVPAQQQGAGQQSYAPGMAQQYQYVMPAPAQYPYTYRPWGPASTEQNSTNQRNSINTWQTGNPPSDWGVPGYSTTPSQVVPQYGGYQGAVVPGYVW